MGFEWASVADVWDKVAEERAEFDAEASGTQQKTDEFGDILFAPINVARWEGKRGRSADELAESSDSPVTWRKPLLREASSLTRTRIFKKTCGEKQTSS